MRNMQSSIINLEEVFYPESDGKPMAENTLQFEWITLVKQGLDAVFIHRDDVFIAGDLLWYPVQGENSLCQAPDTMVALGRPKGHRRSYLQWKENNIPPQVVFEILSPGNRAGEMAKKYAFYEKHGVLEYYVYDPDHFLLTAAVRSEASGAFVDLSEPELWNWTSPLLGISFQWRRGIELELRDPQGEPFLSYADLLPFKDSNNLLQLQLEVEQKKVEAEAQRANAEQQKAKAEAQRANAEQLKAEAEAQRANAEQLKAEAEHFRAETEKIRADFLAQKLRELGIDPDSLSK